MSFKYPLQPAAASARELVKATPFKCERAERTAAVSDRYPFGTLDWFNS